MTEVSRAAGFASLRRFNEAIRATYGKAPRELRRAPGAGGPGALELRLPYRPPLAWDALLAFLSARVIPGVERVTAGGYARVVRAMDALGIVELEHVPPAVVVRLRGLGVESVAAAVEQAKRVLDLAADPAEIAAVLGRDPLLAARVRALPGLRVPGAWDGFELAVRAVLGQQVSVRGAMTVAGRLVQRFGEPLPHPDGELTHAFPTADALAEADVAAVGMPHARAATIRRIARAVAAGELDLRPTASFDETRRLLTEIPGIGPWTVEYVAMRALADPDAFPAGDLWLRRALPSGDAEAWRPWRAYGAFYLWTVAAETLEAAA